MAQAGNPSSIPNAIHSTDSHWRSWLVLLLKSMVCALAISLSLLLLVAATAAAAMAQPAGRGETAPNQRETPLTGAIQGQRPTVPDGMQNLPRGSAIAEGAALLFRTDAGLIAAPLQSTQVRMQVNGHVVRTHVAQTYRNPSNQWMDAVYRFPLPDGSAVDGLVMTVDEQIIRGEIKAKNVARKKFEKARAQGKRASLVTQSKPNDFSARVANIGPNGTVSIEIEYQQVLRLGPDGWSLRFPTVVAPKYQGNQPTFEPDAQGWLHNAG